MLIPVPSIRAHYVLFSIIQHAIARVNKNQIQNELRYIEHILCTLISCHLYTFCVLYTQVGGGYMPKFCDRLRQLRNEKGLSQMELSKLLKISKSSVNMYERGEREPGLEMLELIADILLHKCEK